MGKFGVALGEAEASLRITSDPCEQASVGKIPNAAEDDPMEPFLVLEVPQFQAVPSTKERLASLDVFRGLSIALMILVDKAGGAWPAINHSPWNGVTIADLVMPFFLFIVGVSLALAYKRIPCKHAATQKAVVRAIKLFVLGVLLQGGYFHEANDLKYGVDMSRVRWCGILQRIALGYVVAALSKIWLPTFSGGAREEVLRIYVLHWICALSIAIVHLSLLYGLYVPNWNFELPSNRNITLTVNCGTRGDVGPACNAVGYLDRLILGIDHLYQRPVYRRTEACSINAPDYGPPPAGAPAWCQAPFDPEGILSSISAIVTCFIGLHYGHLLVHIKEHKKRVPSFLLPAFLFLLTGLVLHLGGIRMNKPLYSISYVFFTAGVSGVFFCAFYILTDVYEYRQPTLLLEWMGMNSLLIYLLGATNVLVAVVQGFYWKRPENNLATLVERIFHALIPTQRWATLIYVVFEVFCWCLVAGALKALGILWKF